MTAVYAFQSAMNSFRHQTVPATLTDGSYIPQGTEGGSHTNTRNLWGKQVCGFVYWSWALKFYFILLSQHFWTIRVASDSRRTDVHCFSFSYVAHQLGLGAPCLITLPLHALNDS